ERLYNTEDETDHRHQVGEQGLRVHYLSGPDVRFWTSSFGLGQCGAFRWNINWLLTANAPCDSVIVQEVQVTAAVTDCSDQQIPLDQFGFVPPISSGQRFWEAWVVAGGHREPTTIPRDHDSYNYSLGRGKGRNGTKGSITIMAIARWHPQRLPA